MPNFLQRSIANNYSSGYSAQDFSQLVAAKTKSQLARNQKQTNKLLGCIEDNHIMCETEARSKINDASDSGIGLHKQYA